jgi:hypothetical protein
MKQSDIQIQVLKGREVEPYVNDISRLRIILFREYPYLYEPDEEVDRGLVRLYTTEYAIVVIAKDGEKMIGAMTGVPLNAVPARFLELFSTNQIDSAGIFYLGDALIEEKYRGGRLAFKMYNAFEKAVQAEGRYRQIAVIQANKPKDDPKRPANYVPLVNCGNRGYVEHPELTIMTPWRAVGDVVETNHSVTFWLKPLVTR